MPTLCPTVPAPPLLLLHLAPDRKHPLTGLPGLPVCSWAFGCSPSSHEAPSLWPGAGAVSNAPNALFPSMACRSSHHRNSWVLADKPTTVTALHARAAARRRAPWLHRSAGASLPARPGALLAVDEPRPGGLRAATAADFAGSSLCFFSDHVKLKHGFSNI